MIRARFKANTDCRPVEWPIKHPYWCTGFGEHRTGEQYATVVAYADNEAEILRLWPEASDIDSEECKGYNFTSRFPKPDWFVDDLSPEGCGK